MTKTAEVRFRTYPELMDQVDQLAERADMTRSDVLTRCLAFSLSRYMHEPQEFLVSFMEAGAAISETAQKEPA